MEESSNEILGEFPEESIRENCRKLAELLLEGFPGEFLKNAERLLGEF